MLCTACARVNGLRIQNNLQIAEKVDRLHQHMHWLVIWESLNYNLQ